MCDEPAWNIGLSRHSMGAAGKELNYGADKLAAMAPMSLLE